MKRGLIKTQLIIVYKNYNENNNNFALYYNLYEKALEIIIE